jgi:4-hydroxy-3-methylbut-2-enyl diphosphate reductase
VKISIEEKSGFCSGVKRVVKMAEDILDRGEELYCLGQLVHNEEEVERLREKGLKYIGKEEYEKLRDATVLIRAHGEPPETYRIAEVHNLRLVDGTCGIVKKMQQRVREDYRFAASRAGSLVIYGKSGHPEVLGLNGQTGNNAIVVRNLQDLEKARITAPVVLYSQTTMDTDGFKEIAASLEKRVGRENLEIHNTICHHISHREPGLRRFASENDLILFVAGKESSNGKILFTACQHVNPRSYFISSADELKKEWFENVETTGICGATSTPVWLMEAVAEKVKTLS